MLRSTSKESTFQLSESRVGKFSKFKGINYAGSVAVANER